MRTSAHPSLDGQPMHYTEALRNRMAEIRRTTINELPRERGLVEAALALYARALELAVPSDQPDQAMARMALASHNFNTLFLAEEAAITGFYLQSISLLRGVYENWTAFQYLATCPQDSHLWLEAHPNRRPPKTETMRKRIDVVTKRGNTRLDEMYRILNRFGHTDPVIALSLYREKSGYPTVLVGLEFDRRAYQSSASGISLLTGIMLDALSPWVRGPA